MSKLAASVLAVTRRPEVFILEISTNYQPGAFRHSPFHLLELYGSQPKSIPANILNKQNQIFLSHSPQIPAQKREVSDAEERKGLKH
jgi:hypothetical protein